MAATYQLPRLSIPVVLCASVQERVEQALEDWEELTAPGRPPPTSADIDALARRHRLLAGKWMAFPQRGAEAAAAWAAVARAAVAGELGPQAKISSVDPAKPDHGGWGVLGLGCGG